jgi:hypothetical protein
MQCLDGLKANQQIMILMLLFVNVWIYPTISLHTTATIQIIVELESLDDKVLVDDPCCSLVIARNRASMDKVIGPMLFLG